LPTKVVEFMAMGPLIIASYIAQVGVVFSEGGRALLITPGDDS
jgi:hypothetical protein